MFPKKSIKNKFVYLDNAAATKMNAGLLQILKKYNTNNFSNPSALYDSAVEVKKELENSRDKVCQIIGAQKNSVIFTGSGTESVNLAILGTARFHGKNGKHIITTKIEHKSVLNALKKLEAEGFEITYLDVDENGAIDIAQFNKSLRKDTVMVSIMYANNEMGVINDIPKLGREILKWRKANKTQYPYFHTDACQAGAYLDLEVEKLHVDLMSLNGSKIHGPKGVGVLYKRPTLSIEPIMFGGGQEYGLRPSTENVAGIIAFATALETAQKEKDKNIKKLAKLQEYFWQSVSKNIDDVRLAGPKLGENRLVNNLSIIFNNVDAESLIIYLSKYGIACSSGSACTTDSDEASHVLLACGYSREQAKSTIRFTMSKYTNKSDIDYVMKYLPELVKELRKTNV